MAIKLHGIPRGGSKWSWSPIWSKLTKLSEGGELGNELGEPKPGVAPVRTVGGWLAVVVGVGSQWSELAETVTNATSIASVLACSASAQPTTSGWPVR
jgi:hypothetical protein